MAGAHGKTTTSGMLAEALTEAGADPSFAIGGVVRALGTGAHLGSGPALVAEADESDRSFLNYTPRVEIVTNVEPDHLDSYGTAEAFETAFVDFAHRLVPGGLLVACAADAGALRLAQSAAAEGLRVVTYSFAGPDTLPGGVLVGEGHVHLDIQERGASSTRGLLTLTTAAGREPAGGAGEEPHHGPVELVLAVPGDHVALDAAGAWAAGIELGVEPARMARALGAFGGTGRRFEDRGEADGVRVIDDYAHHPTEIEALLRTARGVAPGARRPGPGPVPAAPVLPHPAFRRPLPDRHWPWPTPLSSPTSTPPGRLRRTSPTSPGTPSPSASLVASPGSSPSALTPPTRWPTWRAPATCC